MNHKGIVSLETERLILRDITIADYDAIHSWCSNMDNVKYMSFGPNSEEATRSFIEGCSKSAQADPRMQYDFALVLKHTGQVIGSGGIYLQKDWHDRRFIDGTLGWILHRDYWKQGYGSEFAAELLRFGFEDCGLHRIHATCDSENYGSYRVMERSGMHRETVQRQAILARDGSWHDQYQYVILAEEYFGEAKREVKLDADFWTAINKLISELKIVIDRPKGTKHPCFDFTYPLDYGYLENTSSMDGGGIDLWRGSSDRNFCDAMICTVDLLKKDSEIKLLLGCTEEEKNLVMQFHNDSEYMKGVMIRSNSL